MMRGLGKLTLTEAKLFLREPFAAFFTLAFPLMMLFIFGAIYGNEPTPFFGGRGSVDVSVPRYMAMIIASVGLLSIAIAMSVYRERGILRRYRATPLRPQTILAATVVVNFGMTLAGAILLIVAARVFFGLHFDGNVPAVLAGFVLSSLSFFAAGFVIASVAPTARVAQVVGMVVFYPMLFLSGAGLPREMFPETLRKASDFLPLTHVVTLLEGLWFGEAWSDHLIETIVLAGLLIVGVVVTSLAFRWE
jgi:ABC-2 type transport system permease protein